MRSLPLLATLAITSSFAHTALADVVTEWNEIAVGVGRTLKLGPNPATRAVAISQLSVYDAVVAITKTHAPYRTELSAPADASLQAAVAQAAHDALVGLFPARTADLDSKLAVSLSSIPAGAAKDAGVNVGKAAAAAILADRAEDGADAVETFPGSDTVGAWRPTPRKNPLDPPLAAAEVHWQHLTPFGLLRADQFRPAAPPALTTAEYAVALLEVKILGGATSTTRTAEQTDIARFWAQQTHIPFNGIARAVSHAKGLTIAENARLFALLNIALADSRIAGWDAKYHYGHWRPITAITQADLDGNPDTIADPTWTPLLETPNHPDYISGHSVTGAAGATVLAEHFGDFVSFAVGSDSLLGQVRGFSRFSDAAEENATSRVYGGIHFCFSDDEGLDLGEQIGHYVYTHLLPPIDRTGGETGAGGEGGALGEGGSAGEAGAGEAGAASAGAPGTAGASGNAGSIAKGGAGGGAGSAAAGRGGSHQGDHSDDDGGCSIATDASGASVFACGAMAALGSFAARRRRR